MSNEKTAKDSIPAEKTIYLQFDSKEVSISTIEEDVLANYESVKNGEDPPADIKIYLKPEDHKAYYVINCDFAGEVNLLVD